jgi:hypothetical protein
VASKSSTTEVTTLPEPELASPWLALIFPLYASPGLHQPYYLISVPTSPHVRPHSSSPPHPSSNKTRPRLTSPPVPSSPQITQASLADATSACPPQNPLPDVVLATHGLQKASLIVNVWSGVSPSHPSCLVPTVKCLTTIYLDFLSFGRHCCCHPRHVGSVAGRIDFAFPHFSSPPLALLVLDSVGPQLVP